MTLYEYTCYDLTGYRNTGREVRAKTPTTCLHSAVREELVN